jgi:hypothetical protein
MYIQTNKQEIKQEVNSILNMKLEQLSEELTGLDNEIILEVEIKAKFGNQTFDYTSILFDENGMSDHHLVQNHGGGSSWSNHTNNFVEINFETLFEEFRPNDKIIDNKMNLLSLNERFRLSNEWNYVSNNDDYVAKLAFIENNKLWGACPEIFNFTDEMLEQLEDI